MTWLTLEPFSSIVVRDGKKFDAGQSAIAESVFPKPSTAAGAVASAIGGDFETSVGPFPIRQTEILDEEGSMREHMELLFPVPRDIVHEDAKWFRLGRTNQPEEGFDAPSELSDVASSGLPSVQALLNGKGEVSVDFIGQRTLADYLSGRFKPGRITSPLSVVAPFERSTRVGLWRENGRTATDQYLYSAENLTLHDGVKFAVEVQPATTTHGDDSCDLVMLKNDTVRFGGEARLAAVRILDKLDEPNLPGIPTHFEDGRVLVYLATPGVFPQGWKPPIPDSALLVAAAVGGPEPLATMGYANVGRYARRGVRELRRSVTAGSVYYVRFPTAADAAVWANEIHGRAIRFPLDPEFDRLSTAGFNVVFTGVWE